MSDLPIEQKGHEWFAVDFLIWLAGSALGAGLGVAAWLFVWWAV